jgi:hypothetical protein
VGRGLLAALVDLAPQDARASRRRPASCSPRRRGQRRLLHERSARSLQRVGDGKQAATLRRVQAHVDALCAKVPAADRSACKALLPAAPAKG